MVKYYIFFLPANSGTYALCGSYEALITTV